MKSWLIHYKNKFINALVQMTETALDVFDKYGNHVVALRKNGNGQWVCMSKEFGCTGAHDLAPIPRDARVFKEVDGKIVLDDQAAQRRALREKFLCDEGIKVLSMDELKSKGYEFDAKGNVTKEPAPPVTDPVLPVGSPAEHETQSQN